MKAKKIFTKTTACIIASASVIIAIIYVSYLSHENFRKTVVSQIEQQLQATNEATARGMEEYLAEHLEIFKAFARDPNLQQRITAQSCPEQISENIYCPIENFYQIHKSEIYALTVFDAQGVLLHGHPGMADGGGLTDAAKRDIAYVSNEHKSYISQTFVNERGNLSISVSEPIFKQKEFIGIVRWVIEIDTLARRFITPIKVGRNGFAWMFDDQQRILSYPRREFIGITVLDVIRGMHVERGEIFNENRTKEYIFEEHDYLNRVATEQQGTGIYTNCLTDQNDLVAFWRIPIGQAHWNLILTLPYKEIAGPINRHAKNTTMLAGLLVLVLGTGGFMLFRSQKRQGELEIEARYLQEIADGAEALRESEQKLSGVIESVPDYMCMVDQQFNIVWVNENSESVFGADILGRKCFAIYQGRSEVCEPCIVKKCFEDGRIHEFETDIAINGRQTNFWCIANVAARDEHGKPKMVVELLRDITHRKRAEQETRVSEERYRKLFEQARDGIFLVEAETGIIVDCNQAAAWLVEREKSELIGQHQAILHPASRFKDTFTETYKKHLTDSEGSILEAEVVTSSGAIKIVAIQASLLNIGGKKYMQGMFRDITKLKWAEEKLRESEKNYREILDAMGDWIHVVDRDLKIVMFNSAFMRMNRELGLAEEVIGRSPMEIFSFLPAKIVDEYRWVFDHNKVLVTQETTRIGDREFVTESRKIPLVEDGRVVRVISLIRDMTEQKRFEVQFYQAQKMESIGTLAGGVAHDFNNLLMGLQGRNSLMLMDIDSTHPHYGHLKEIENIVWRAAELAKQLLGFARGGKYEVKPVNLNEIIKVQNHLFGRTKKEITIHEKFAKDLWTVEADQGQIEQVMLNLYINAWQAMPNGGDLFVQTENVVLDENYLRPYAVKPGNYVKISVTDSGVGIDEAIQQKIFDPFFTIKEMGRGTGLGLASVYGIIKNHGGIIDVYSVKGRGATFHICLPASAKDVIAEKKLSDKVWKGKGTVLLVDDEQLIIDVGTEIIKSLGYEVLTARSGKEALDIYANNRDRIDIVLLDLVMPGMSGGDTFIGLKEINPDVRVLLSSGYSINGQASSMLKQGCDGFIQKPYNMKDLSQKIHEILTREPLAK
ncbi:MAG: PAS domain S-box protein [Proteobacteria bacterium]|nr:PAS domain S-box protein [Pseudomonadota bacterium]MBU4297163.1 PAS domain S-box protein [Pseudomonadota bacterium]MCG2749437.1 PAS domain S-box protein [Desulfobulbaceae bacterium]